MPSMRTYIASLGHDAGQNFPPDRQVPLHVAGGRLTGIVELQGATPRREAYKSGVVKNIAGIDAGHVLRNGPQFIIRKSVDAGHSSSQRLVVYGILNRVAIGYPAAGEVIPGAQRRLGVIESPAAAKHQRPYAISHAVSEPQ